MTTRAGGPVPHVSHYPLPQNPGPQCTSSLILLPHCRCLYRPTAPYADWMTSVVSGATGTGPVTATAQELATLSKVGLPVARGCKKGT